MAILADLVDAFHVGTENVATEALCQILKGSRRTRQDLIAFCGESGADFPGDLSFTTQAWSEEDGRPDLIGECDEGTILVVEAKFDAGLTDRQPVSYFHHLSRDGLLLFVAPEYRLDSLWGQLKKRCSDGHCSVGCLSSGTWPMVARVDGHRLALVSWRALLGCLLKEAEKRNDQEVFEDLSQLRRLCDRMDEKAFVPFREEELTSEEVAGRFAQLARLPHQITTAALGLKLCSGVKPACSSDWIGDYFSIEPYRLYVGLFFGLWQKRSISPIWVQTGVDWKEHQQLSDSARQSLKSAVTKVCRDRSLPVIEDGYALHMPLPVKAGAYRDEVLNPILDQLRDLRDALLRPTEYLR
jgi:hypothetical protein